MKRFLIFGLILCSLLLLPISYSFGASSNMTSLVSGWNFVSPPRQPVDPMISEVLRSISGSLVSVWSYSNGEWKVYYPNNPGLSDLDKMEAGFGYWIEVSENVNLFWPNSFSTSEITLKSGWNHVGFNYTSPLSVFETFGPISNKLASVWEYKQGVWSSYIPDNPASTTLLELSPGAGYWIQATEGCQWTFPILSDLADTSSWTVIDSTDNKLSAAIDTKQTGSQSPDSQTGTGERSLQRTKTISSSNSNPYNGGYMTILNASGLVDNSLDQLYVDNNYVIAGSLTAGYSALKLTDLQSPVGKVFNYKGRETEDASDRFGCSGFAKRATDGKIFAWYGHDIVDVLSSTIVFTQAPDYTHGGYGCSPKNRFVIDETGKLWIGTSNVAEDGGIETNETGDANGLFKIAADFSSRSAVIQNLAVWDVFKDSTGTIWISSHLGIYKRETGGDPSRVYDSEATDWYGEQIFEYNGSIYAILKNFFHNPSLVSGDRYFDLYKWDETDSQFEKVCDILQDPNVSQMFAFVYASKLYVVRSGNGIPYEFNDDVDDPAFTQLSSGIGEEMGQYRLIAQDGVLFSTGNIEGVSVYNFSGGEETIRLTPVNTAEGLIVDNIHNLYSHTNGKVFIGPDASGFNIYENDQIEIVDFPNQVVTVGFFEHNGTTYVQGASDLYTLTDNQPQHFRYFPTNGEKIYYDSGHVWTYPNWGSGYGAIAMLDLATGIIKGTNNYSEADEEWALDRSYHFQDIIAVPSSNAVFIAVCDSDNSTPKVNMPYVLRYDYGTNTFTKSYLPDGNVETILTFVSDGIAVYAAARQQVFRYQDGAWTKFCDMKLGNDIRGMKIAGNYLFIVSGWNSDGPGLKGGIEVVDLRTLRTTHYYSSEIPIPSNAVFALEVQNFGESNYRLWIGTFDGLAFCDLNLGEGNSCLSALPVDINTEYSTSIQSVGDKDYYEIKVPSAGIITAYSSGATDTYGQLRRPNCSPWIGRAGGGEGTNFLINAEVNEGTYYVIVNGEGASTGDYTLHIEFKNCLDAIPISIGVNIPKNFTRGGCDFYSVEAPVAGKLVAYTTGSTDTRGNLLRPDCSLWMSRSMGGEGDNFSIEASVQAETYFLAVTYPETGDGGTGSYTLHTDLAADMGTLQAYIEASVDGGEWFHFGTLGTSLNELVLNLRGTESRNRSSANIARFEWDFGDGNISEGELVSHTYATGVWPIGLTVYDSFGNSASETLTIEVGH
jgi:hypothetical protein